MVIVTSPEVVILPTVARRVEDVEDLLDGDALPALVEELAHAARHILGNVTTTRRPDACDESLHVVDVFGEVLYIEADLVKAVAVANKANANGQTIVALFDVVDNRFEGVLRALDP